MRRFVPFAALILAFGCGSSTLDPLPLTITITAAKGALVVGEEAQFTVSAQGTALLGIVVQFGDSTQQELQTFGARTARANVRHVYNAAGVYNVIAQVQDGPIQVLRDSTRLTVTAASAGIH